MPVMKLAFLFVLLVAAPGWAGPTAEDFDKWSKSAEWWNLLHMQKGDFGLESKIRGGDFFLNSEGRRNPQAELETDYQQMFEGSAESQTKAQCRFLARRDFFLRMKAVAADRLKPCAFSDEWLKRLNAQKISLIFASGYLNSAPSSFGHTFLRLENPIHQGGQELLDYGINFSARTSGTQGALYALYGLLGFFPGKFAMLPYHQLIKDYTHLEGRDLWEYELNFTSEEVRRVVYHLLELESSYVDYYFLDDNCSFLILKVLEVGRPGLQLAKDDEFFVIPLDTVKKVIPIVSKFHYRPSLETEWNQRVRLLNSEQRRQIRDLSSETRLTELATPVLEAANYFVALKELENYEQWKGLSYNLKREQASRGKQDSGFQVTQPLKAPHESHNSSAIETGLSERENKAMTLGLRAAFHDQLSNQNGVPPFSHLEVLGFRWRATTSSQIVPIRYRVLETLSTRPVTEFETPMSWGVLVGGDSWDFNSTQNQATARVGLSVDPWPDRIRWTVLAVGGAEDEQDRSFQFVTGADSRLWILWADKIRSLVQAEWTRHPSFESSKISVQQAFDLDQQLELRLGWAQSELAGKRRIEKSLFLLQNF